MMLHLSGFCVYILGEIIYGEIHNFFCNFVVIRVCVASNVVKCKINIRL